MYAHQNKSGATFHVEVSSRQIVIENTPYLISIVRDISDRLKTEQNLHFRYDLFDLFLEYSPIFVFVKDAQIRSVYLSRNYEQMLGMPLTEVLGKTMDELFPSEMAKKMIEDDKSVIREGKPCEVVEEFCGKPLSPLNSLFLSRRQLLSLDLPWISRHRKRWNKAC